MLFYRPYDEEDDEYESESDDEDEIDRPERSLYNMLTSCRYLLPGWLNIPNAPMLDLGPEDDYNDDEVEKNFQFSQRNIQI